ncbi:hypothetical protein [Streptomyces sp. cg36]|uniref:hypothetical protein n=1 Tax=Streptomyces sp. cg36 TaxID=3238798 RepID=UPI0034E213B3
MYVMRLLTAADTAAAVTLVQDRVRALDAELPGEGAAVPLRIAAFLGTPPSAGGCVAGLFDDDLLRAVVVLAREDRTPGVDLDACGRQRQRRVLEVVEAYTHARMRHLRLGVLLSMWVSDQAACLTPPASRVTVSVHDRRLADYLCQMCAWELERQAQDGGRQVLFLHRAAERLPALDQAILTEAALRTALKTQGPPVEGVR